MTRYLLIFILMLFAQVPDTYWEGAGDTPSMNDYQQAGGYLRFTEYPVRVYLELGASDRWQLALTYALEQLAEVMPIIQTRQPSQADIFIDLVSANQLENRSPCDSFHQDACSQMIPIGEPTASNFRLISRIWLVEENHLPAEHLLLHELLHALGLLVHSPYPEDVLYNQADAYPISLSERDRATLIYLYTQPAIGE
jgi:predicted Zn-dependent protease